MITFDDLAEVMDPSLLPMCDLHPPKGDGPTATYSRDGVYQPGFKLTREQIDAYSKVRLDQGQWPTPVPYMHVPELRAICLDERLTSLLSVLFGRPMGLHLNLTNWKSTERNWHQDVYLNPPHVGGFYCAVWFALEDIHPSSGPFEYIPESHRWPWITRANVLKHCTQAEVESGHWPKTTERFVVPAVRDEMVRRKVEPKQWLGKRGEMLIWHCGLMHRGSPPKDPEMERRGLIAHYSSIHHRPDFPKAVQDKEYGGWYFPIED